MSTFDNIQINCKKAVQKSKPILQNGKKDKNNTYEEEKIAPPTNQTAKP
jgi:hypothetical protein